MVLIKTWRCYIKSKNKANISILFISHFFTSNFNQSRNALEKTTMKRRCWMQTEIASKICFKSVHQTTWIPSFFLVVHFERQSAICSNELKRNLLKLIALSNLNLKKQSLLSQTKPLLLRSFYEGINKIVN